ncbi:hypothetical protein BJ684DRAFT_19005 [Piptocephalis cylindrospora]|uniref:Tail specific protease domain-containing protein n=1 Tax=Piptocephalis cylindrospora TaxID=1907219 RepID=A0A4P9Y6F9_9FUNG|nr:hypothetical protein BJ684DRAFT_19005 [Piptocephalis cylindrospora]|eukprot:RKP14595.1 hypothetical protein BJ684DRAFT_19005 [Piptocephalis cylindrospora]
MLLPTALILLTAPFLVAGQVPKLNKNSNPQPSDSSACVKALSGSKINFDDARDCYRSFPYDQDIAEKTIESVSSYMSGNVFASLNANPPDSSFVAPYDIVAALNALRPATKTFPTDFDFQTAVRNSLVPGMDGHLSYIPKCYSTFRFTQPFMPIATWEGGRPRFTVGAVSNSFKNMTAMTGAEIISIQGVPALEYFTDFANKYIGASKDPITRLTMAMGYSIQEFGQSSPGLVYGRWADRSSLPDTKEIQYVLRPNITAFYEAVDGTNKQLPAYLRRYAANGAGGEQPPPQTIHAPWSVRLADSSISDPASLNITSTNKYWEAYCAPSNYDSLSTSSNNKDQASDIQREWFYDEAAVSSGIYEKNALPPIPAKDLTSIMERFNHHDSASKAKGTTLGANIAPTSAATSDDLNDIFGKTKVTAYDMAFTILKGGIGVIQITKMSRIDLEWAKAFVEGAESFRAAGVRKWVVDLSNNAGGYICTSQTFLPLLLRSARKNQAFPSLWNDNYSTIRISPLVKKFHDSLAAKNLVSLYSPNRYGDPRTNKSFTESSSWINPGMHLPSTPSGPQGNPSVSYTLPGASKCLVKNSNAARKIQQMLATAPTPNDPSDLIVFSNGYCGSACANLAEQLADRGVKTVLASAFSDQQRNKGTFSTFPGGEGIAMTDLAFIALRLNDTSLLPAPLPVRGTISFATRAVLSKDSTVLEFRRRPADMVLPLNKDNAANIQTRWKDAASLMGWMN